MEVTKIILAIVTLKGLSAIKSDVDFFKNLMFLNPKALATDFFPTLSLNKTKKTN
jgi:hypothetical protein